MNLLRVATCAVIGLAVLATVSFGAGEVLSRPASRAVGKPPLDFTAESIRFTTTLGDEVAGWFSEGKSGKGTVLLLHGVRADRTSMLERARLFLRLGYSVLLIDLPAHGESTGDRITFGLRESEGARAALAFLRSRLPGESVAVVGVSLGAASLVLSKAEPPPAAVVLESMYPTISEAIHDRLQQRLGSLATFVTPLLLWQLPLRLGITPEQLRPIADIAFLRAPVLIASGTRDLHTRIAETRALYDAAVEPKELWAVEGAAHVDLYAFEPRSYEARVIPFLAKYMQKIGT